MGSCSSSDGRLVLLQVALHHLRLRPALLHALHVLVQDLVLRLQLPPLLLLLLLLLLLHGWQHWLLLLVRRVPLLQLLQLLVELLVQHLGLLLMRLQLVLLQLLLQVSAGLRRGVVRWGGHRPCSTQQPGLASCHSRICWRSCCMCMTSRRSRGLPGQECVCRRAGSHLTGGHTACAACLPAGSRGWCAAAALAAT